jgi:hypothetical protein
MRQMPAADPGRRLPFAPFPPPPAPKHSLCLRLGNHMVLKLLRSSRSRDGRNYKGGPGPG